MSLTDGLLLVACAMSIVQLLALGGTVLLLRDARMDARLRRRLEALCDSYMIEDPGTVPVLHRFGEGDFDG